MEKNLDGLYAKLGTSSVAPMALREPSTKVRIYNKRLALNAKQSRPSKLALFPRGFEVMDRRQATLGLATIPFFATQRIEALGFTVASLSSQECNAALARETDKWAALIREANIRVDNEHDPSGIPMGRRVAQ